MAIGAVNGVTVDDGSTILGISGLAGILGQALASGGAGDTLQFTQGEAQDAAVYLGTYTYWAAQFTTGGSGFTVHSAQIYMQVIGAIAAGTYAVEIWTNAANNPGTLVGTGSAAVDRTTFSGAPAYSPVFTGMNAVLSAATTYFFVVRLMSGADDYGIQWNGQTGSLKTRASSDGSSWLDSGNQILGFKLFGA